MEIYKLNLGPKNSYEKEWLISNGAGAYSSSTLSLSNSRKYHGILVAALNPPAQRHVVLSKIDDSIELDGKKYVLANNEFEGFKDDNTTYFNSFKQKYYPEFEYVLPDLDVNINKKIVMERYKNRVYLKYSIDNNTPFDANFNITPILNFRNFHVTDSNVWVDEYLLNQNNIIYIIKDRKDFPLRFEISEGIYESYHENIFQGMKYSVEEERGFPYIENHSVPGTFKINLKPREKKEIVISATLETELENNTNNNEFSKIQAVNSEKLFDRANNAFEAEENRIKEIINKAELKEVYETGGKDFVDDLIIGGDKFIIKHHGLTSIIAGYPWFIDWGRDSLLAMEGILLSAKRYDEAKELFRFLTKDIKEGLVANSYCEYEGTPYYNAADASLLLFELLVRYTNRELDYDFILEMYPHMKYILDKYIEGTDFYGNNIFVDTDGLLSIGRENIQSTWMDAKIGDDVITPRNGKAVEINALWYNALTIFIKYSEFLNKNEGIERYIEYAEKCRESFNKEFISRKGGLKDLTHDDKIRPNQLFAISTTFPIIDLKSKTAKDIILVVKDKLLNKFAIKSLARGEEGYTRVYEGSPEQRDRSYHQGISWAWLNQLYYDALINVSKEQKDMQKILDEYVKNITKMYSKEIYIKPGMQAVSELNDSIFPFYAKGAPFQAWSIAAIIRIVTGN